MFLCYLSLCTYLEVTVVHSRDVFNFGFHRSKGRKWLQVLQNHIIYPNMNSIQSYPNRVRCCVEIPPSISDHFTWLVLVFTFLSCRLQSSIPCSTLLSCQKSLKGKFNYQNRCVCWRNTSNHSVITDRYWIGSYSYASEGNRFLKVMYLCCVYKLLTSHHCWTTKMTFRKLQILISGNKLQEF